METEDMDGTKIRHETDGQKQNNVGAAKREGSAAEQKQGGPEYVVVKHISKNPCAFRIKGGRQVFVQCNFGGHHIHMRLPEEEIGRRFKPRGCPIAWQPNED
eukprot:TRINITY_DN32594_c0_g1_i1.p3 TRINITY_DN32594_c0_g1~~TRINITY_DN32594_c0_g1_i1.p3  ORF type:complete len:102 (+),score=22.15 TRINITY_DN32594_c0_g1_i1:366-671(+)